MGLGLAILINSMTDKVFNYFELLIFGVYFDDVGSEANKVF